MKMRMEEDIYNVENANAGEVLHPVNNLEHSWKVNSSEVRIM